MKYTNILVIAVLLFAGLSVVAFAHSEEKLKIIPASEPQVKIHESHDWRLYHSAMNHTKSDKVIKVRPTEIDEE